MITDVNVSLSRWPCRRFPFDTTAALSEELLRLNVTQAWAGTFDAMLHLDIAAANQRLVEECRSAQSGLFVPVGAVNLSLPAWEDDVRRCHELHNMPGLRLLPGYHDYRLNDHRLVSFLELATERRMFVQIAVRLEDSRTQHRLLSVPDVDLEPLKSVLGDLADARVILLNAISGAPTELHGALAAAGNVWFDIAVSEGLAGLERLTAMLPSERLLFGSHAPFYVPEAAKLKLLESELPAPAVLQISRKNAESILAWASTNTL